MKIHHGSATVKTGGKVAVENVTGLVRAEAERSGISDGFVLVSVPHTTCGLVINEDERGLRADMQRVAGRLLDPLARERGFEHDCIDDNAQAHLTSILLGHSLNVPLMESGLVLGTWQSIFVIEMDGPRSRSLNIQVIGT